ncbi:MAG: AzlD domain-containing protein [Cyanophyceae cyanobacterium]
MIISNSVRSGYSIWLITIAIGIITFLLRFSFIYLFGRMQMPLIVQRALRFVPVTVLPALISPQFFYQEDTLDISLGNERLLAGLIAAFAAWRTQNVPLTIGIGMTALWILQAMS